MTLLNMTLNISGTISILNHLANNQAESLAHHNLGHRPKIGTSYQDRPALPIRLKA
jgi:hypothetical protein